MIIKLTRNMMKKSPLPIFDKICPSLKHLHGQICFSLVETRWDRWERKNKKIDHFISMVYSYKLKRNFFLHFGDLIRPLRYNNHTKITMWNWWYVHWKEIAKKAIPSFEFEGVKICVGIVLGNEL